MTATLSRASVSATAMAARNPAPPPPITRTSWAAPASPAMVWAKLFLDRLAVVPDRPYLGAAVVVFVADPATAAVVVLVANDQADVVPVLIVIARYDLAARCLFGREMDLCANHRSLPSRMAGEFRAAGRRQAGRADHDARVPPPSCTAIMFGRSPSPTSHSAPRTGFVHGSVRGM